MAYRVELSASARAICRTAECKSQKVKIGKNELRFGVWVDYGENQSWAWRHWGCVTPQQLSGLQDKLEGDVDMLDGYEELPEDCQEKVKRAVENGHVDDEDWRGDLEQNRPGKRGFRSPAAKKKKKAEEQEQSDAQGDRSPSKPAAKKRGRAKKEDTDDDDVEEPAQKKTKVRAKKGKKIKDEDENVGMTENEMNEDAAKPKAKRGKQAKGNNIESDVAAKPKAKASAKTTKAPKEEHALDEPETAATVPKKTKAAAKKGKKAGNDADAEDPEAQPVKAGKRGRKVKEFEAEDHLSANEHHEPAGKSTKKPRATKNAANMKKPIAQRVQKGVEATEADLPAADVPKPKRGRKKTDS
ncbi:MAG: hypothetical protein Q9213_003041 [Squamulea squamosa]